MSQKTRQLLAVFALAAFLFVSVFGTLGLIASSHHTCNGIHCRTCERITVVEHAVNILKAALIFLILLPFMSETIKLINAKMPPAFYFETAVTLKTKLSN